MTKYVTLIFALIFRFITGTVEPTIQEYTITRPDWENNYRNYVLEHYDDNALRKHFKDLRLPETNVPTEIDNALKDIIKYETGKSIILDIIAALEPRISYAESLHEIFNTKIINGLTMEQRLKSEIELINFFHPKILKSCDIISIIKEIIKNKNNNNKKPLKDLIVRRLIKKINYEEVKITLGDCDTNIFLNEFSFSQEELYDLEKYFKDILKNFVEEFESTVNKYRFTFSTGESQYNSSTRVISLDPGKTQLSAVSGPILQTYSALTGVVAKFVLFTDDEKLLHEILHYYHMTLREETINNNFFLTCIKMIEYGIPPNYTRLLNDLWHYPEELKTITGLVAINNKLMYSKQCESRYINEKGKPFRFSHSSAYFTKCPWYFVQIMEKIGIKLILEDNYNVEYISQFDNL